MSRGALRISVFPAAAIAAIALVPLLCLAAKEFVMPQAQPAKTYPAHDEHPLEAVAVAVDPYDLAEKTTIFSVHYSEIGFMPIFVVVTNDGNQPVELAGMKAQLVTVNRAKLVSRERGRHRAATYPSFGQHQPLSDSVSHQESEGRAEQAGA